MKLAPRFYAIRYRFPRDPDFFRVASKEEAVRYAESVKAADQGYERLEEWLGDQMVRVLA